MPHSRQTVLLTGFGPFPRVPFNATSVLVPRIAAAASKAFPGIAVVAEIVPTEWVIGLQHVEALYRAHRPALAIHFGVSHRATGFVIEARGRNVCSATADAAGFIPLAPGVSATGPEYLPTGLPAALIVDRLRRRRFAAQLSRDAGNYLCNALMYRALELARRSDHPVRNGFVHLPTSLVDARGTPRGPLASSPLNWAQVIEGGLEIIATCLARRPSPQAIAERVFSPSQSARADASRSI